MQNRFYGFPPSRGNILHWWLWNLAWRSRPHLCGLNNGKIYKFFILKISQYKCVTPVYLLPNYYNSFGNCWELYDRLCIKILLDSFKEFQSYGGLNLRGSGYLQNFLHPVTAKLHLTRNKLKIWLICSQINVKVCWRREMSN